LGDQKYSKSQGRTQFFVTLHFCRQ